MSQAEKKKKARIVTIIAFLGVAAIAYLAIDYQKKHNHTPSSKAQAPQQLQVVERVGPQDNTPSTIVSPKKNMPASVATDKAVSLAANTQLPSDIPPAMLEAMQERGMTVEQLRGSGKGSATMNNPKNSPAMDKDMSGKEFPSAMQKALAERNATTQAKTPEQNPLGTPEEMRIEIAPPASQFPPYVYQAVTHVGNHKMKEQIALLTRNMDVLAFNPNDVQVLVNTSNIFLSHNEIKAAQYLLERATIAAPSDAHIAYLYGLTLSKNFESEKAAKQWERSLHIKDTPQVRLDLALLYRYQLNQPKLAKENLEKALTLPDLKSSLRNEIQRELDR